MQNFWPPNLVYSKTAVSSLETITGRTHHAKSQSEGVLRYVRLSGKFESVILLLRWPVKNLHKAGKTFSVKFKRHKKPFTGSGSVLLSHIRLETYSMHFWHCKHVVYINMHIFCHVSNKPQYKTISFKCLSH